MGRSYANRGLLPRAVPPPPFTGEGWGGGRPKPLKTQWPKRIHPRPDPRQRGYDARAACVRWATSMPASSAATVISAGVRSG